MRMGSESMAPAYRDVWTDELNRFLLLVMFGQGRKEKSIVREDRKTIWKGIYFFLLNSIYSILTSLLQRTDKVGDQK